MKAPSTFQRGLAFHLVRAEPTRELVSLSPRPKRHFLRGALTGAIPAAGALLAALELVRFFISGGF
ncbi:MAG TPA: hypothetical protein VGL83_13590 [Stellaceae bacterium]|jgi:hypothetical protein